MSSAYFPASRPRYSFEQFLLSILMGLLIFVVSVAVFIFGYQVWYAGRIFPGVKVAGVDVGGMRQQEAAERITENISFPITGKLLLRDGDKSWIATPVQLGLYLDPQASAKNAFNIGREGWLVDNIKTQFYAWYSGREIPAAIVLDQRTTYNYLASIAQEIDKPTIESSVELKGTEVIVQPGQIGRSLDIPKNLTLLSLQVQAMHDSVVNLFVVESAPVLLDASKQAELIRQILSKPVTLALPAEDTDQQGPWTIDQQALASMITFERGQGEKSAQYEVQLKEDMLRTYLMNMVDPLRRSAKMPRMTFNTSTSQFDILEHAVTGRDLDVEGSIKTIEEKIAAGDHNITLAVKYSAPPVTDQTTAESLGIKELIHSETSYFYGSSASRVQNISTAASKFHGVLVAPGATFSMADTLGDITLDNGYAEALIILGGQTIKGVGGGVCQVSTTLFRAAFFAGFPIAERHAHAYRVYYYEKVAGNRINPNFAGLDATVFVPLVDFKFVNDTPYWLLMETYVDPSNASITWNFYSTSENRRVEWDTTGPTNIVAPPDPIYKENPELSQGTIKQVDWAAQGADVTVNRTVYRNDQVYLQDTFSTHYEAWADTYEYGPGTDIPNKDANKPSE